MYKPEFTEVNSVKPLSEMTLEELWELFPIFLVEHNEKWAKDYSEMEGVLRGISCDSPINTCAVGSVSFDDFEKNLRIYIRTDEIRIPNHMKGD